MFGSSSELPDQETLKSLLSSIPTNYTSIYFSEKQISGFHENLEDEIQYLLVSMQLLETHLQKIINFFLLFLENHEKIIKEKDEEIYNLSNELKNFILKTTLQKDSTLSYQNLIGELNQKNGLLQMEIEELQNTNYEIQNKLYDYKLSINNKDKISSTQFLENLDNLKLKFPNLLVNCEHSDYNEIKKENRSLCSELRRIKRENEDQNLLINKQKLELNKFKKIHKKSITDKELLKNQLSLITEKRDELLEDLKKEILDEDQTKKNLKRMRSLSLKKDKNEETNVNENLNNKFCRSPLLRKPKKKITKKIENMRANVRRKTKLKSIIYESLLTEIEKNMGSPQNRLCHEDLDIVFDIDGENDSPFIDKKEERRESLNSEATEILKDLDFEKKITKINRQYNVKYRGFSSFLWFLIMVPILFGLRIFNFAEKFTNIQNLSKRVLFVCNIWLIFWINIFETPVKILKKMLLREHN